MNIAIAGYGIEGESSFKYWSRSKKNNITIFNEVQPEFELPIDCNLIVGEGAFQKMNGFDLVIRTAGLAPRKIKTDGKIWSATNEFFAKCPAKIIGITGTKGKGTTASLIASILRADGKKVWLLGNIGTPALDHLTDIKSDDIVVYELSSFQLWDLEYSPSIAVVLMIEPDHLNVHLDMDEYVFAKSNITKYQKADDLLVYNQNNNYSIAIAKQSKARNVGYVDKKTTYKEGDFFYYDNQKICSIDDLKIVGNHNVENACASINAIWDLIGNVDSISVGLKSFNGLDHRLKFIRTVDKVSYYDDSIATTPGSAIAALRSFSQPKVIILGGSIKNVEFDGLSKELKQHDVRAVLIGENATTIADSCEKNDFFNFNIIDSRKMSEIVSFAKSIAKPDSVVILSPASASFGMFKNYADRGDQFKLAVERL